MKPNWKDAPEWANYLAQDDDQEWWWFECEPDTREGYWYSEKGKMQRETDGSESTWKESLEQRNTNAN